MPMTLPYSTILFDLDGTLTDPKEGITKSIQYALNKMGIVENDLEKLTPFIGPPLLPSFMEFYNFSEEEANQTLQFYRERFSVTGLFENEVYEGIEELLKNLKQSNYRLAVATSKPTVFAKRILDYFELSPYFEVIVGSELDGTRTAKGEVIAEVLKQMNIENKDDCVMIGDRMHDLIGASENAIDSIGVTYGYGSQQELEEANATYIVHSVGSLSVIFGNRAFYL